MMSRIPRTRRVIAVRSRPDRPVDAEAIIGPKQKTCHHIITSMKDPSG